MAKVQIQSITMRFVPGFYGEPQVGDHYFVKGSVFVANQQVGFEDIPLTKEEEAEMTALCQTIAERLG
jgi:hypothetical protein